MNTNLRTVYYPAGMTFRNDLITEAYSMNMESNGAKSKPSMTNKINSAPKSVKKNVHTNQKQVACDNTQQRATFKDVRPKFEEEHQIKTRSVNIDTPAEARLLRRSMPEITSTVQNQISPPKTICRKNKAVKRDTLNFNINKYSVYNVDINNIKIPSLRKQKINMQEHENEKCKTASMTTDDLYSNDKIEKHFENKRDDSLQKYMLLKRSKSAVQLRHTGKSQEKNRERVSGTTNISDSDIPNDKKVTKLNNVSSRTTDGKKCDCENCDSFINCITWCDNNTTFEKSADSVIKKVCPLLKTSLSSERPINIKKICSSNILVHGVYIPQPIESLMNTCFNVNIQKAISNMNCSSAKHLQSYMWPSIQRGLNVVMVGRPQSGKTLAYLPAICTFAVEKSERYCKSSEYDGPQIIILCPNNEKCKQLKKLIDFVTEESWEEITTETLSDSTAKTNCDILVAIPSTLEDFLKSERIKLKRLCHIVMEDTDLLLKDYHDNVEKFLTVVNKVQANRPHIKNIRLIVTSERWTIDIEHLVKKLYMSPTIAFEDFLEAAICSKTNFIKKKLNSAHRIFYLEDILKKQYSTNRSIVFCHEHEIAEVQEYLEVKGVECILISNDLSEDAIFENEDMWCSLKMGRYKVLLCTDAVFDKTVQIVNANWLIHYSLPSNWSMFRKRFRCLSENFICSLENTNDSCNYQDTCSFLLGVADETTEEIFTKYFDVLTRLSIFT